MTSATAALPRLARPSAMGALKAVAAFWFIITALGQSLFVLYILGFHGRAIALGQPELMNKVLPKGYVPGDTAGNLALVVHVLFAVFIIGGGLLQLVPQFRIRAPRMHRWNGRLYVTLAVISTLAGTLMLATRGTVGGPVMHAGMLVDAVLILLFAWLTVREAHAKRLDSHRRWALRLFMTVSAVWFFRIGLMAWLLLNGGPAGFDPGTFRGPFLDVLAFAQYLLPLAVLELYLRARSSANARLQGVTAALLAGATLLMCVGIFGATMGMWLPRLS
ncbi:DUF2306 domain-containing protein [Pseudoduganella sp.]|uniref:DUF2306 domain-containing protein n=1 Tax=Pseudoduganella sp. TaxID=1880898 RepID=UPI0035B281DE